MLYGLAWLLTAHLPPETHPTPIALGSGHPCGPWQRPDMSSVKPGQRAFEKQLRESSGRKSGQQNKANLSAKETQSDYAPEPPWPEQPCDREERALSWAWPCLLANWALPVPCPLSKRPHGTRWPLTQPGDGRGEGTPSSGLSGHG